ncbi:hypothetical protein CRENBAI_005882 [Crenichthys baileyi]|uniref:Uncharacterized protein n=1 Tax=Crenichthys baileyi TaxID=28760 RepID=A0AAV9RMY6_9TELE
MWGTKPPNPATPPPSAAQAKPGIQSPRQPGAPTNSRPKNRDVHRSPNKPGRRRPIAAEEPSNPPPSTEIATPLCARPQVAPEPRPEPTHTSQKQQQPRQAWQSMDQYPINARCPNTPITPPTPPCQPYRHPRAASKCSVTKSP